ncbi:MAG: ATP-binding protein [Clostridiales bacterium]|nr:ATP-binding protein [Clostridiales bacterium]
MTDMTGTKQAVYFTLADNGWLSVITIPYAAFFGDLQRYFYLIMALCAGVLFILLFMSLRERRLQKGMARVRETVSALGNQYFAIYRVNWSRGTYESVKSSDYIQQRLPEKGSYEQLLNILGEVIEQDTFSHFRANFSLENIRRLVEEKVSNFGGDFRRLFGQEYRWVNVRLLFDSALQPNEAILCFRQVDREKLQQIQQMQALERALDRAKESEATQERFFSQMSHDMRTPLNVVSGTVQLAKQRSGEGKDLMPYLDKIQIATEQLLALINDILEISRMKKTGLQLKPVRCNLEETIREGLSVFQTQAEMQKKSLSLTLSLTQPQVIVDAFRLQQVLNNLVSNALKFTEAGDEIRVSVSQSRSVCKMTVQDTGMGISEEFLPHLFTPYARESRFEGDSVPGTGLGLSIAQEILTCMGGQIQVESKPGQGTTFTTTIPMEPAPDSPDTPAEEEDDTLLEVLRDKHLLLAEDFEMNLEVATELLTLCGATVTQARNGKEAVELFQASPPGTFDGVLMDMNMPVMDGCAAAAAIRALDRPDAATLPILAVTANTFAEDAAAAARAGMNAHIPKPIDMRQLARALKQCDT